MAPEATEPPSIGGRSGAAEGAPSAPEVATATPAPGGPSTVLASQAGAERIDAEDGTAPKPSPEGEKATHEPGPSRAQSPPCRRSWEGFRGSQRTRAPLLMKNGRGRRVPCSPLTAMGSPGPELPSAPSLTKAVPFSMRPWKGAASSKSVRLPTARQR
jgi:hypothetical protein